MKSFPDKLLSAKKVRYSDRSRGFLVFFFLFFVPIFFSSGLFAQSLDFSYSYLNITRNNGGGTLEVGDTIEVHALVNVKTGTSITNVYFIAPITTGTQYVSGSLKFITNEGVVLKAMTDASNDDDGVYDASAPGVRINIGTASAGAHAKSGAGFYATTGGGVVTGGNVPKGGGGTMGIISYKLKVTAAFGDIINPTGTFYYTYTSGGKTKSYSHDFNYSGIKIIQNQALCVNFTSASFTAESSFGSGNIQNRALGVTAPGYTKVNLGANSPGDNYYSVADNTSADGTTNNTVPYAPSSSPSRVFGGYWDIIGDHTNAADPVAGNAPVSPGTTGGYMLVVNANIATGEVYRDDITNLCPNTYYEFSAWFRNICGKCGQDLNGAQTYQPGVKPNLTYAINDVDYYSTGDISYTKTWIKRGFIYKTGPTETGFTLSIKNNASGGGGNDWVLDDINLATCYPNLTMNPNDTATACAGFPFTVTDTVKSFYNNYGSYRWEISKDHGVTWIPASNSYTKTPVLVNGLYEYHVDTVFTPQKGDSGVYFRLKVATTISNLTNVNCSVDNSQKVFLKVYSTKCSVLDTRVVDFDGMVVHNKNVLKWSAPDDEDIDQYEIEKSSDGISFLRTGILARGEGKNGDNYSFTDPDITSNLNYYRLKLVSRNNAPDSYSRTILLYNKTTSFRISAVNPFYGDLKVNLSLPEQGKAELGLFDMYGKCLSRETFSLAKGNSQVSFDHVGWLPPGMYILTALHNGTLVQAKLIKSR